MRYRNGRVVQQRWTQITSGRPHRLAVALLTALLLSVLALSVPGSTAAWTVRVRNSTNTAAAAPYFTCAAAYAAAPAAYYVYPLADNPVSTTAADTSGNNRTATYLGTPAHSTRNGCARDTNGSTTFDGTTTWLITPDAFTGPQTFTIETWFRTGVAGGYLIGFNNSRTDAGGNYDRHLYLDATGRVTFGVYADGTRTLTSPLAYNDSTWHHAAATFTNTAGLTLYVDGRQIATLSGAYTAENTTGYWRIGYGNLNGWPNPPTNTYFNGQLAYATVYTSALTATTITNHHAAGKRA